MWRCGARSCEAVGVWGCGGLKLWGCGAVGPWGCGAPGLWGPGAVRLLGSGAVGSGAVGPWGCGALGWWGPGAVWGQVGLWDAGGNREAKERGVGPWGGVGLWPVGPWGAGVAGRWVELAPEALKTIYAQRALAVLWPLFCQYITPEGPEGASAYCTFRCRRAYIG